MYARKVLHSITIISTKRKNVQQILSILRTSEKEKNCVEICLQNKLCSIFTLKILPVTSVATKVIRQSYAVYSTGQRQTN